MVREGNEVLVEKLQAGIRDDQQRIDVVPWRSGIDQVVVTVTSPRGTTFTLRRLTRQHLATRTRLPLPGGGS